MVINANTRISPILKFNEKALDAITSINTHFHKLRNPLVRKLMAGRTTLAMASRIGGCSLEDFYSRLEPLGFEIDRGSKINEQSTTADPSVLITLKNGAVTELDVRPILDAGKDPLDIIMSHVQMVNGSHVLKIINSFVPTPLISLLQKQGFESATEKVNEEEIATYFYKVSQKPFTAFKPAEVADDWFEWMVHFQGKLVEIDVRGLQMPQPMHNILDALEKLPENHALFVYHSRIPVFLLPELNRLAFSYRVHENPDGEFFLLIFRP
jgi:uncharacterized protein (DUF2249 family)